jgi:hypothetical protein
VIEYILILVVLFTLYSGLDWITRTFFGFGLDSDPLTEEEWEKEQAMRLQASKGLVDDTKLKE